MAMFHAHWDWASMMGNMTDGSSRRALRKATNVTLPEALLSEAKALGINVSQACERGLELMVSRARSVAWLDRNRDALDAWNEYVERKGLPLREFRQF